MADKRGTWENSPELRDRVREDLDNWALWYRGGLTDLSYPRKANFTLPSAKPSRDVDIPRAERMESSLTMWALALRLADEDTFAKLARRLHLLKIHFLSDRPVEAKRKIFRISRSRYYDELDDAMFRLWVISD